MMMMVSMDECVNYLTQMVVLMMMISMSAHYYGVTSSKITDKDVWFCIALQ